MERNRWIVSALIFAFALSVVCVAQVKKEDSPFAKYRRSSVNDLEFRKLKFDVAAMRASLQPTPLPTGLGAPFIGGETVDGKLVIEVEVYFSELPETVDARKDALIEAVIRAGAAFSDAFYTPESGMLQDEFFKKWTVVQFFDGDKLLKRRAKRLLTPISVFARTGS